MTSLESQIITSQEAYDFLIGNWATKPAEVGFAYEPSDLAGYRKGDLLDLAHMVAREIDRKRESVLAKAPRFSPLGGLWNDWDE